MHNYKVNKIAQLENPYHKSNTTINTETKSQLFHLNQRSKVNLTEESDE